MDIDQEVVTKDEQKQFSNEIMVADLSMLVRRLCKKLPEDDPVRVAALDYLQRKSLAGNILREEPLE